MCYIITSKGGHIVAKCTTESEMRLHYEAYASRTGKVPTVKVRRSIREGVDGRMC